MNKSEDIKDANIDKPEQYKPERNEKRHYLKGQSGNPKGRPKRKKSTAEAFRRDPKALEVLNKVIEIASTLGSSDEHKDATSCAKVVVDKIIPTLKAQDISIESDSVTGFVVLPKEEESKKEE